MNEFDSGAYDDPSESNPNITLGESILIRFGFTHGDDDEPFSFEWAGLLGLSFIFAIMSAIFFDFIRFATGKVLLTEEEDEVDGVAEEIDDSGGSPIPFKRVDLTFHDIHYTVKSSISDDKLELLKGISQWGR